MNLELLKELRLDILSFVNNALELVDLIETALAEEAEEETDDDAVDAYLRWQEEARSSWMDARWSEITNRVGNPVRPSTAEKVADFAMQVTANFGTHGRSIDASCQKAAEVTGISLDTAEAYFVYARELGLFVRAPDSPGRAAVHHINPDYRVLLPEGETRRPRRRGRRAA